MPESDSDAESRGPEKRELLSIVKSVNPNLLHNLKGAKRSEFLDAIPQIAGTFLKKQIKLSFRSGPLPSPEDLERYNQIIPGGADRIMTRVEKQSTHRQELERTALTGQLDNQKEGRKSAERAIYALSACGVLAMYMGESWVAGTIFSTTIVAMVTIFITGKHQSKADLANKLQALENPKEPSPTDRPKNE